MGEVADGEVPVVYKGAIIAKLILQENQSYGFVRGTGNVCAS
jgi:hypothetical protein